MLLDFSKVFYYKMLFAVFAVTTDTMHKNGFFSQCRVLRTMIAWIAESPGALIDDAENGLTCNHLKNNLIQKISVEFPNMNTDSIHGHVTNLMTSSCGVNEKVPPDNKLFEEAMTDFLIESKVFQSTEDYQEISNARSTAEAKSDEKAYLESVPGIVPDQSLQINP